jgi:tetratricopeptide (TPR) repeat protein
MPEACSTLQMLIFAPMKYLVSLFLLCIALFSCNVNEADKKEKSGDVALEDLNKQIAASPSNAELYHTRANYYFTHNQLGPANEDIHKAVMLDSTKSDYFLTLANITFVLNKTAESKKALEKSVALNPKNNDALLKLAELYLYVGQYKTSINYADSVLLNDKYNAKGYFLKGMNFKMLKDTDRAISSMQTTVEQDPDYYNAYVQLGLLFAARNNPIALNYYDNALNLNPKSTEVLYAKGMFFQERKDTARAMDMYNMILQVDTTNEKALYNIGYLKFMKNDFSTAQSYFEKSFRKKPTYTDALYMVGLCLEKQGANKEAFETYNKVIALDNAHEKSIEAISRVKGK